jgi:hypothetical protein
MRKKHLVAALIALLAPASALAAAVAAGQDQRCTVDYRPKTDETAFAAVGSALKVADRRCRSAFLIIPFSQTSGAITFPSGQFRETGRRGSEISFSTVSSDGDEVESCLWCDPLKEISAEAAQNGRICVTTQFNVKSCSLPGALSYAISARTVSEDTLCAPSLMYYGRSGTVLKFAVNDCKAVSRPTLTYDLRYGSVIRFLDEQFEVLSADNEGIRFRRLKPPKDHAGSLAASPLP